MTSVKPAARASAATASPWVSPISTTTTPSAASQSRGLSHDVLDRLEAGRSRVERARGLPLRDIRRKHLVVRDVRRVRHDEVERGPERRPGARRTTPPARRARPRPCGPARRGSPSRPRAHLPTRRSPRSRRGPTAARARATARSRRNRCRGRRCAARGPSRSEQRAATSACSTTCSVSGLGMSTRPSTHRSSSRNDHDPSTYCNGSPAARRVTISSKCAAATFGRRGVEVAARRLLGDPLRLPSRQQPRRRRRRSGRATTAAQPAVPASCLVRSSATSASMTSSSSPASTRSSL